MGKYIFYLHFFSFRKKTRCNNNLVDEVKSKSAKYSRVNFQNENSLCRRVLMYVNNIYIRYNTTAPSRDRYNGQDKLLKSYCAFFSLTSFLFRLHIRMHSFFSRKKCFKYETLKK